MLRDGEGENTRIDRVLELLVVFVLATSGVGLVSTLAGVFFAPQVWIASLTLTGAYAWWTRGSPSKLGLAPRSWQVALLLLVGLFFRLPAYHYVLGGQDEGLYVNIANYIERTGGIKVRDTVLERLQDSSVKDAYLRDNRVIRANSGDLEGGSFVAGVYVHSSTSPKLEFQFYHLFPVWMALFGGVFGSTFGVYALTLFALLSIIFFYRLALLLTHSHRAALLAGLLLALSPLHAFFSKFPVTEVPTLAFSTIAFTFAVAFWRSPPGDRQWRWLWLSSAAFAAMFFTRISGLLYIPFVAAAAIASAACDDDVERRRAMVRLGAVVALLYGLSVVYGLHWSHRYATDIYRVFFAGPFGEHWRAVVGLLALAGGVAWWALVTVARRRLGAAMIARWVVKPLLLAIPVLLFAGLLLGILKIYRLGWTGAYAADPWLSTVWHLAGSGWTAVRASSLAALLVYLGPFIPLMFLYVSAMRPNDLCLDALRVFVVGFFVYAAIVLWTIPYGPYYARYLLSELVPYMLLLVVCAWSVMPPGRSRLAFAVLLVLSTAYAGATSLAQIGKQENDGLYVGLRQLVSRVDPADVVLLDSMRPGLPNNSEVKTPLVFTFGLSVVTADAASIADPAYIAALNSRYDDVFLISPSSSAPQGFAPVDSTRVRVWAFRWGHGAPMRTFLREDMRLYLYKLDRPIFPLATKQYFRAPGAWTDWLESGWNSPENWGVWSLGRRASLRIDPRQLPQQPRGLTLRFEAQAFVTPKHPRQTIRILLGDRLLDERVVEYPKSRFQFVIPLPPDLVEGTGKIDIGFELPDATAPKAVGLSRDARVLGVGLISVTAAGEASVLGEDPLSGAVSSGEAKVTRQEVDAQSAAH